MNNQEINEYIVKRGGELPKRHCWTTVSDELRAMGINMSRGSIAARASRLGVKPINHIPQIEDQIRVDLQGVDLKIAERDETKKYKQLLVDFSNLKDELEATLQLQEHTGSHTIKPESKNGSESTAVTIWSDWHIEEKVDPETVNGMNEFTLDIAKARTETLARKCVDFIKMYQQDTVIKEMIIALLGDFISNDLHDENPETAQLLPIEAIIFAQHQIISGIDYILGNTDVNLTIPCHSGNHARTTKKVHHATEHGHSLEYIMYHNLADHYGGNPRVKFIIPRSYHSFIQVYDYTIRFHHGHDIKYGGGIGGLFIPAYKAISQWDKTRRADLDCFGHFHQTKDGGNFYCNGSLIGFNPYAIAIKADFERPRQNFFLIHRTLGRTIMSPIQL